MMGKRTMLFRKKCKCVFFLSLLLILGSMAFFDVHAQETDPAEKTQIPFDLERFLFIVEEQDNPYLGLNIFRHTIEEIHKEWKELEAQQHHEVSQMIFVEDSRVVGMSMAGGYSYVGKESIGYDWFVSEGVYQMLDQMNAWPDADVILCFGINDVANIGSYISEYQYLVDAYPDTRFWFMSVNPVNDAMASSCGYFINSDMVISFNNVLQQAFPEQYLDVCSYLQENGYGTSDGVHYDVRTCLVIQEYTKYLINQKES